MWMNLIPRVLTRVNPRLHRLVIPRVHNCKFTCRHTCHSTCAEIWIHAWKRCKSTCAHFNIRQIFYTTHTINYKENEDNFEDKLQIPPCPQYYFSSSVQLRVLELVSSDNRPMNWSNVCHYLTANQTVWQERNNALHFQYILVLFPNVAKTLVFLGVIPYIMVDVYNRVGEIYCLYLQSGRNTSVPKSEVYSINIYENIRRHIQMTVIFICNAVRTSQFTHSWRHYLFD
jgi:hypothetical protein